MLSGASDAVEYNNISHMWGLVLKPQHYIYPSKMPPHPSKIPFGFREKGKQSTVYVLEIRNPISIPSAYGPWETMKVNPLVVRLDLGY